MLNVLYISPSVPVSISPHAGGQLAHYYVKKLKDDPNINLRIICYTSGKESNLIPELKKEKFIAKSFILPKRSFYSRIINKVFGGVSYGFLPKETVIAIKNFSLIYKKEGFIADQVIFDWEETCFILPFLKRIFPNAKFSVVEQDVKSQSLYRFYKYSEKSLKKLYNLYIYKKIIRAERKYFPILDEIVVLSNKDKKLIEQIGIEKSKIRVISPYFYNYSQVTNSNVKENQIVFMGFLKRIENQEAVEWFINNVIPIISNIKFVVIGGGIPEKLKKYQSQSIIFTDFIEIDEIKKYYENSICMVVPLFHGAGVKIKVLEGMSAGLPILTNNIGIEGIDAIDGESFLKCDTALDYKEAINKIINNKEYGIKIGNEARKFIHNNFNYEKSSYI